MPTKPVPEVLRRNIEDPKLAEHLATLSGAVEETVSFGTHVLKWCVEVGRVGDENAPLHLSLRHAVELLDSISVLLRQCCVDPCKILLRALLEVLLGVLYILQADSKRRAMSFMVCYAHDRLKWCRKFDATTPEGEEYASKMRADESLWRAQPRWTPEEMARAAKTYKDRLADPQYAEAEAEYQRLRRPGTRSPDWYALFGGPRGLEQLAKKVGCSGKYELFYRQWSELTHGTDIIEGKVSKGMLGGAIFPIRLPEDTSQVGGLAVSMALALYRPLLGYYVPDRKDDLEKWYDAEIRHVYMGP